jgi:hypothetical protein
MIILFRSRQIGCRLTRRRRMMGGFAKVEGKDSHPLSVYNFCFCLPMPQAIEEYLSKPAGFFWFRLFLLYRFVSKQLLREEARKVSVSAML